MCLKVKFESRTNYYDDKPSAAARKIKKIAEKDIDVIKLLLVTNKGIFSPYLKFEFKLNETLKARFSYSYSCANCIGVDKYINQLNIERGLHSLKNISAAEKWKKIHFEDYKMVKYFKGIIPKGSFYFIDEETGEMCSNQLIVTETYYKKKK